VSSWPYEYSLGRYFGSAPYGRGACEDPFAGVAFCDEPATILFPGLPQWQPLLDNGELNLEPDLLITSGFGKRAAGQHDGTDYAIFGPMMTPFNATVIEVGNTPAAGNYITIQGTGANDNIRLTFVHLGNKDKKAPKVYRRTVYDGTNLTTYFTDRDLEYEASLSEQASVLKRASGGITPIPVLEASRETLGGWDLVEIAALNTGPYATAVLGLMSPRTLGDSTLKAKVTYAYNLKAGDYVRTGDLLGFSGNTGRVRSAHKGSHAGTHLHLAARVKNQHGSWSYIDPALQNWKIAK